MKHMLGRIGNCASLVQVGKCCFHSMVLTGSVHTIAKGQRIKVSSIMYRQGSALCSKRLGPR